MSNQPSAPNLMASRGNAKQDSTRILSYLSSDSSVVPARAKSAPSQNKIFALLTGLLVLVGATTVWFMQLPGMPATTSSLATIAATTYADAPTQTAPNTTALALSTWSEPQAALIVNEPNTDDISKKEATPQITPQLTSSVKPFAALTENTTPSVKTTNAIAIDEAAKADQKTIAIKNDTPAPRAGKVEDDTDVTLLAALIKSAESPTSAKKNVHKKTSAVAERLKSCQKLEKKEAARCSQKVCKGQAGKSSACQKFSPKK